MYSYNDEEIALRIKSRYSEIYVVTPENNRVVSAISRIAQRSEPTKKIYIWTPQFGFRKLNSLSSADENTRNPIEALRWIMNNNERAIFVLEGFHHYMTPNSDAGLVIIGLLKELSDTLHSSYKTIIIVAPVLQLPPDLEKDISVIYYSTPSKEEIMEIIDKVLADANVSFKINKEVKENSCNICQGLTKKEIEDAVSKSVVKTGTLDINIFIEEKAQAIQKTGILDYCFNMDGLDLLGGLEMLKEWVKKRLLGFTQSAKDFGVRPPRGLMLLGVTGCGKSLSVKCIAKYMNLPLVRLDVGKIFQSGLGDSERNIRLVISICEALQPLCLWIDEFEKAFSGLGSSNYTDGGVTARVIGAFLTWQAETKAEVLTIATANDVEKLEPEQLSRFDETFYFPLPYSKERIQIFSIHLEKRGRNPKDFDLGTLAKQTKGFTGREIERIVISGLYNVFYKNHETNDTANDLTTNDLLEVIKDTIPISVTNKEKIEHLNNWCKNRAKPTSLPDEEDTTSNGNDQRKLEV